MKVSCFFLVLQLLVLVFPAWLTAQHCGSWTALNNITKEYDINSGLTLKVAVPGTNGRYYVMGDYGTDSVLFGNGVFIHDPAAYAECFVAAYDSTGQPMWASAVQGDNIEHAEALCTDENGNLYAFGRFRTDTLFIAGDTLVNHGVENLFIVEYTWNGMPLWARSLGSTGGWDRISRARFHDGTLFFSGWYKQSGGFAFDTLSLPSTFYSRGFIIAMDTNGLPLWSVSSSGNTGHVEFSDIDIGQGGSFVVSGKYSGGLVLDTLALPTIPGNLSAGFLAAFSSDGHIRWAEPLQSAAHCALTDVALDIHGNTYAAGWHLSDSLGIAGQWVVNTRPYFKLFVLRASPAGMIDWLEASGASTGGNSTSEFLEIGILNDDRLFLLENVKTDSLFVSGDTLYPVNQSFEIWLMEMDAQAGKLKRFERVGSVSDEYIGLSGTNSGGEMIICGSYSHSYPLIFGDDTISYPYPSNGDVGFVARYSQKAAVIHAADNSFCAGDSLLLSASGPISWAFHWYRNGLALPGDTLGFLYARQGGSYTLLIDDGQGCADSSSALALEEHPSYTLQRIDSICFGEDYVLPDGTLVSQPDSSQSFGIHLLTEHGCDSTIELWLEVTVVDTAVLQNGVQLSAQFSGATYQWLDCDNGYSPLPGATQQSFFSTINGQFAVAISYNDCMDTSSCHTVMVTAVHASENGLWQLYPNPTSGILNLLIPGTTGPVVAEIFDIHGRLMRSYMLTGGWEFRFETGMDKGLYLVRLKCNGRPSGSLPLIIN